MPVTYLQISGRFQAELKFHDSETTMAGRENFE